MYFWLLDTLNRLLHSSFKLSIFTADDKRELNCHCAKNMDKEKKKCNNSSFSHDCYCICDWLVAFHRVLILWFPVLLHYTPKSIRTLSLQSVLYHVSWWYYTLVIDLIGQLCCNVIGRLSVKRWCHWLCVSICLLSQLNSCLLLVKLSVVQSFSCS